MTEHPQPGSPANSPPLKELTGRIGKYEITRPLGKGAMGIVYLAHDTVLDRDVALKVMVSQIADDPELRERFEREARAVAKMTHPNVVNVFDLGTHTDGSPYMAMELLKGHDLQKAMRQGPALSLERKLAIIVQVLGGLAHAHEAGIVHRDIKPANVFINADGAVKIMDFGVARLTTASMTGTGNIVGTADYMSPEQVQGARVDGRSDLFSVGCMLYELLAGQRPFHSDNLMAIFYKITHEEADFSLVPRDPESQALLPILRKALARNLADRYQTAYEFATDLRDYLMHYAGSRSGQWALEQILEIVPRPGASSAATMGRTVPGVGRPGATLPGGATVKGGSTVMAPSRAGTMATTGPTRTRVLPGTKEASALSYPQPRRIRERRSPLPMILGGVALLAAVAGGGYYFYLQQPRAATTGATSSVPVPPPPPVTTAAPVAVTSAPTEAPTAAPIAALGEVEGKAAGYLKAAHAAMTRGDYQKALDQAQAALREDAGNAQAQQIASAATDGQKAVAHFRLAEDALRAQQFADAQKQAEAGRALAPWDKRGPDLLNRVHEAETRAQQEAENQRRAQAAAQMAGLLGQAANELAAGRFDAAIGLYDEVLKIDAANPTAISGRTSAIAARAIAQAQPKAGGKAFVAGKTTAQSLESQAGRVPAGFDDGGVAVKRTVGSELPGKINLEIRPQLVLPGEKYTLRVEFVNEGDASIPLKEMVLTMVVDGKKAGGPVPLGVKEVAPHQKETLFSQTDFWKEVTHWSMEVLVRTVRGDVYKNQVTWK